MYEIGKPKPGSSVIVVLERFEPFSIGSLKTITDFPYIAVGEWHTCTVASPKAICQLR